MAKKTTTQGIQVPKLIGSLLITFSASVTGSLVTTSNIPNWYATLEKPPLIPPNEVFGPVWATLYFLMGLALYNVWVAKSVTPKVEAFSWFGIQLVLNALWPIAFFGAHRPALGIFIIMLLIGSIAATMISFRRYSRTATWLLAPYIAWVAFATYLTIGVSVLNS